MRAKVMLTSVEGAGPRLRSARRAKSLSGRWMVDYINGYMVPQGYPELSLNTYYSWEKIGTSRENKRGRRWPHMKEIKIMLIPLGITGYWLFNGDMDGRIVRDRSDIPSLEDIDYGMEQLYAVRSGDKLKIEINRLIRRMPAAWRRDLTKILQAIR